MSELTTKSRELLAGITPGPWEAFYHHQDTSYASDYWTVITSSRGDRVAEVDDQAQGYEEPHAEFGKDAEFIAAAPQLVADLTAALERVEKLAERWAKFGWPMTDAATDLRDALEGK